MEQVATREKVKVWDPLTRLFHWSLAGLFIFLIISGDQGDDMMQWHFFAGYMLSGLILFRIIWGFVGPEPVRFRTFLHGPYTTLGYLKEMLRGEPAHHYSHNPLGGWMVVVLLLLLGMQAASGMMTSDDILWDGPFYAAVSEDVASLAGSVHHQLQALLQVLVILHVAAIIYHKVRFKDPLVPAMIHGHKPYQGGDAPRVKLSPAGSAVAVLAGAGWAGYLFSLPL